MMARRAATKAEADSSFPYHSHATCVLTRESTSLRRHAVAAGWRLTYPSLSELTKQSDASEAIKKANNYLEKFRTEYSTSEQTAADLKPTKNNLRQTLDDIKKRSEKEVE
jgi:hypothetical protein